jgi:hypothetical protein
VKTGELRHRHAEWLDPRWQQRWYQTFMEGGDTLKKFFANWKPVTMQLVTVAISAAVNALVAVQFNWSGQWKYVAMTAGTAVLSVVLNWLNPTMPAFGLVLKRLRV